ncbi:hypothetical protein NDU88_003678 [Pleurodeles waltl]|uniref:Uncharacterized protein n=1 Tax=Pleurodeles waltl TaxID=8319 RepID=A0AAV7NIS6_PLEWA|nr:hypothetical protein NDU88_003678 [Pleurodeles waltl]
MAVRVGLSPWVRGYTWSSSLSSGRVSASVPGAVRGATELGGERATGGQSSADDEATLHSVYNGVQIFDKCGLAAEHERALQELRGKAHNPVL